MCFDIYFRLARHSQHFKISVQFLSQKVRKEGKKPHFRICIFVSKKCQDFLKSETSGPHHFPIRWLLRSISLWSHSGSAVSMQLSCCLVYLGNVSVGHLWSYHKKQVSGNVLSSTKIANNHAKNCRNVNKQTAAISKQIAYNKKFCNRL